jgi:hypothetical protein
MVSLIEDEHQIRIKTEDNDAPLLCLLVQDCGDVPRYAALFVSMDFISSRIVH